MLMQEKFQIFVIYSFFSLILKIGKIFHLIIKKSDYKMNIFKIKPSNGLLYPTNILFKIVHANDSRELIIIHYMLLLNYMLEKIDTNHSQKCFKHVLAHFAIF